LHHLVALILLSDLSVFHLNDAPISFRRQDDYLILFHGFAVCWITVHLIVQNSEYFVGAVHNFQGCSSLRLLIFTASVLATAPIVCVDFYRYSGNFAFVDGRKGWHNKTSQSK